MPESAPSSAEELLVGRNVTGSRSFMYNKKEGCPMVVEMIDAL